MREIWTYYFSGTCGRCCICAGICCMHCTLTGW